MGGITMKPNERPTPLTEALREKILANESMDVRDALVMFLDFARDLERKLAERTEERDKWQNIAAQYSSDREYNANMALAFKAERDSVIKERDALQIQHGTCSICGFVVWKERGIQQDCQYCAALSKLNDATELLREIRDGEVNAEDEADKFLRDHQPSKLSETLAKLDAEIVGANNLLKQCDELRAQLAKCREALNRLEEVGILCQRSEDARHSDARIFARETLEQTK
jgi:hypothetical protein